MNLKKKRCVDCGKKGKEGRDFRFDTWKRRYDPKCRTCRSHYQTNKRLKDVVKKLKWLNAIKDEPCKDCSKHYSPWILQFDHLDGSDKTDDVSALLYRSASKARILAEIEKCELVCANCHAERTHQRRLATGTSIYRFLTEDEPSYYEEWNVSILTDAGFTQVEIDAMRKVRYFGPFIASIKNGLWLASACAVVNGAELVQVRATEDGGDPFILRKRPKGISYADILGRLGKVMGVDTETNYCNLCHRSDGQKQIEARWTELLAEHDAEST